ncbi:MAG: tetratricopeptide repeat-containing sensor histidine kinase, partial [Chitinophagaceae bacterium]
SLTLPGRLRSSYINMYTLIHLANEFYQEHQYDSASRYWLSALDTSTLHHFEGEELHDLRIALNNNCFLLGDYTGAMKISTKGLEKAELIGDENRVAHFNNVIGYIYMKLGDFKKANNYFMNFLKLTRKLKDSLEEGHALFNLGDLAIAEKQYDRAIDHFNESLHLYLSVKNLSAGFYADKTAYVYNKLAQCWKLKGNLQRALKFIYAPLAATNMTSSVNAYDKADYFINGGDIYNRLDKPDSAMILLKEGLGIAIAINHREFKRDALDQIAISYSRQKKIDSAFFYQSAFLILKDSILNEISREEIYQRENDLQLDRQNQLQKIALQRQKFWKNIIIAAGIFLLLTVIFFYNRYQLKQKNRYQKELNRQQVELFNAIAAAQEQERKRIAQDIHDSLGSVLSAAKLKLEEAKEQKPELGVDVKFLTGISLLDEASAELRNISQNIMPATLSKLGLVPALKNLSEKISSDKGLKVQFNAHELNSRLDEQTEISIYRIILELMNNIVKHATATVATVQLVKFPDNINITVEDNGKGFDYPKTLREKKGIGLGNIHSRVDYMKGTINIDASPGMGTTVIIDIPIPHPDV